MRYCAKLALCAVTSGSCTTRQIRFNLLKKMSVPPSGSSSSVPPAVPAAGTRQATIDERLAALERVIAVHASSPTIPRSSATAGTTSLPSPQGK